MSQESNFPKGCDTPNAPWNQKDVQDDEACLECTDAFEVEDDDGHEEVIVPVEIEAGRFCSDNCARKHREREFQVAGLAARLERVREALSVLEDDLPHLMAIAGRYEPPTYFGESVDCLPLEAIPSIAAHFYNVLDREGR